MAKGPFQINDVTSLLVKTKTNVFTYCNRPPRIAGHLAG